MNLRTILENWGYTVVFGEPNPAFCRCNFRTTNGAVMPVVSCMPSAVGGPSSPAGFDSLFINNPPTPLQAFPELLLPGLGVTVGFENLYTLSCINNCIYGETVLLDTARLPPLLTTLDVSSNTNITGTWPSPEFFSITTIIMNRSNLCCPDQIPAKNIVCRGAVRSCLGGIVIPPGGESALPTATTSSASSITSAPSSVISVSSFTIDTLTTFSRATFYPTVSPAGSLFPSTISSSILAVIIAASILAFLLIVVSITVVFIKGRRGPRSDALKNPPEIPPSVLPSTLSIQPVAVPSDASSPNTPLSPKANAMSRGGMFPDLEDDAGPSTQFMISTGATAISVVTATVTKIPPPIVATVPLPAGKESTWQLSRNDVPIPHTLQAPSNPYMQIPSWPQYSPHPRQPPPPNTHISPLKRSVMDPPRQRGVGGGGVGRPYTVFTAGEIVKGNGGRPSSPFLEESGVRDEAGGARGAACASHDLEVIAEERESETGSQGGDVAALMA
ncbi:hypothetical protein HDU67_006887 [Dinochytrium kinnereticum]|nr:hypothetical protein HDU67_006887 [Dinochytrium kinnereticum]